MSQIGPRYFQFAGRLDRLGDAQVSRVRTPPECIEHQHFEATKQLSFGRWNGLHVRDVRQLAETIPEYPEMPMLKSEREHFDAADVEGCAGFNRMEGKPRLGGSFIRPYRVVEDVVEGTSKPLQS